MSISDRLDEIDSVAPYLDDDDMEAEVLAATAALRGVLELHVPQFDRTVDHDGEPGTYCDMCNVGPWPCPTVLAVEAALGEGS